MKQLINLILVLILFTVISCQKDLPNLPMTGNQGTFCWEQFQNNSFDPVSEWVASDQNDFGPCPIMWSATLVNNERTNIQFAKNTPNVIYYQKGISYSSKYICKYDFCTSKETIISPSSLDKSFINEAFRVGNEGEVLVRNKVAQPIHHFEYLYTENDFNSTYSDTGMYYFYETYSNLIPGQEFLIHSVQYPNYNLMKYDLVNNTKDTLHHLSNYYIHDIKNQNTWCLKSKTNNPDFFNYNSLNQSITPISGMQNVSDEYSQIEVGTSFSYLLTSLDLHKRDNGSGGSTLLFDTENYNNIYLNEIQLSPDENFFIFTLEHREWYTNCRYYQTNYMIVYNIQTNEWKAVDFDD